MSRTIILIILGIVAIVGGIIGYRYISNSSDSSYELAAVQKGELVQEISASGKVEPPTKVGLHFKNSGKLTVLSAKVGTRVAAGQLLAKQDTGVLDAQLAEMRAGIDVQKAKLDQLRSGASPEDITVGETAVTNAEGSVANAKQSLQDAKQSFVDKLQDAYTKADDAVRSKSDQVFTNPLTQNPQLVFWAIDSSLENDVEWRRLLIEYNIFGFWKPYLDKLTIDSNLTEYASTTRKYLGDIKIFMDKLALALNNPNTSYVISGTSATMPSNWKTDISTARTNINTAFANLSAAEEKLRTEESDLKTAEGSLKTVQDQLTLKKAPARSPDVALYEAQIRQAEAQMQKIQAQRQEMIIVAPSVGVVTQTNGEVGEIATPDTVIVSLMPSGNLQIKVNISEADVVNVSVGQEARITLDAFDANTEWKGGVASIDPAETIVGGAVYYQTTVLFDKEDERIRSGMTANVWIKALHKENAFFVPAKVVKEKEGKKFIEVLEGNRTQEKEVKTGMKGESGTIEIISGLNEGEKVIVGVKKQ